MSALYVTLTETVLATQHTQINVLQFDEKNVATRKQLYNGAHVKIPRLSYQEIT